MFDLVCIFTTGGVMLFYKAMCALKFDIVDYLIKNILIQEKNSQSHYSVDPYTAKWKFANEFKLIFVVIYQEMFHLTYVEELLELMKDNYIKTIAPTFIIKNNIFKIIPNFESGFDECLNKWEEKKRKIEKKASVMRSFEKTEKGKEIMKNKDPKKLNKSQVEAEKEKEIPIANSEMNKKNGDSVIEANENEKLREEEKTLLENRNKLANRFKKPSKTQEPKELEEKTEKISKKKKATEWSIPKTSISSKDIEKLDASKKSDPSHDDKALKELYLGGENDKIEGFIDSDQESSEDDSKPQTSKSKGLFSRLSSSIKNLTGNKVITNDDLESLLNKFKEDLMSKNVAEEISQKLCDSIRVNLVDKKTEAFTSLYKTVKLALEESLTKILTPKKNIDIISEALKKKEQGKPYVISFIGVNGVGKSTNLAKIAYLFKKEGFSLMLAACDNFRAGAVEQIKTHGRCLDVPVFDRGYKEEPPEIAQKAIREATLKKIDVVLIDTAGRMQDNEPLMKALSRLIILNQPDLVIFIGEALTGNDASDQLMKFNKSIIDLSPKENIREIDAIILSKFDTVDDKVGTAISLTYLTGKPILFCGVGQKYTHLKKLNVRTVIHSLLS